MPRNWFRIDGARSMLACEIGDPGIRKACFVDPRECEITFESEARCVRRTVGADRSVQVGDRHRGAHRDHDVSGPFFSRAKVDWDRQFLSYETMKEAAIQAKKDAATKLAESEAAIRRASGCTSRNHEDRGQPHAEPGLLRWHFQFRRVFRSFHRHPGNMFHTARRFLIRHGFDCPLVEGGGFLPEGLDFATEIVSDDA